MTDLGDTTAERVQPQTSQAESAMFRARLVGELDLGRELELDQLLDSFRASNLPVAHVDVSLVTFMDSTALRMLAELRRAALDRHGRVILANPNPTCSRLLEIVGMDNLFDIEVD